MRGRIDNAVGVYELGGESMKRKIILLLCAVCLLTGCEQNAEPTISTVQMEYSDFNLIVDQKTKIVYIDNKTKFHYQNGSEQVSHIYTPYFSERGNLCRFDDGEIKEIIKN